MDQVGAMRETIKLAKAHPWYSTKDGCSLEHLESMLARVEKDKSMSDAKVGRWLGWMQAVVCLFSPANFSLSHFKELNKRFSDKKPVKGKGKKGKGK